MPKNKVLVISGPTATGKTALAVEISKLFPAEIISADSRQVYIGMDIGVGKDHPAGTPIHGIDLITPKERYSVSQFQRYAFQKIDEIHSRGHLPIVVGCTGFYINSILKNNYATFHIKPNYFLRFFLDRFPLKVLQFCLKLIDFPTYSSLNSSDVRNPRRLIRKIEIKLSSKQVAPVLSKKGDGGRLSFLHLSLTAPNSFLYPRIDTRVQTRLDAGLLDEIKNILKEYSWNDPGLKSIAYYEFKDYFKSKISLTDIQSKWANDEHSLARRQKTYFKIIPGANFIDISKPNYLKNVLKITRKWYNEL